MCEPTTIGLVLTAVAGVAQGYQQRQQGQFQEKVGEFNARLQQNEAQRTRTKGTEEENKARRATAELISRQRAQLGASNVDVGFGSALHLQEDAATLGEVDALRIRSNFEQRASALEEGAELTLQEGEFAKSAGKRAFATSVFAAGGAILGGSVASKWFTSKSAAITQAGTGQQFAAFA